MKKILLIGKMDRTMENLYVCLSEKFYVQLCVEDPKIISGIVKIIKPDMVVIGSLDLNGVETEIFDLFLKSYSQIPVLAVCTEEESSCYPGYFDNSQFEAFLKPVSKVKLYSKCNERLGIEETADDEKNLKDIGKKENSISKKEEKQKTILVIDDSPLALRSVKAMLDTKYHVFVATEGEKAISVISKKHPDLILLDYEMPGMDGRMTLEKIREDNTMADIPVIFLTAVADKDHIAAVLRLNPAGYFLKPLDREKVLEAIEELFEDK